jgi:Holliday junction DNA helicase RuvA
MKGIGAKTAQRVILELKDKIKRDRIVTEQKSVPYYRSVREEAITALVVLGLAKNIAEKNVDAVLKLKGGQTPLEEVIKYALKM